MRISHLLMLVVLLFPALGIAQQYDAVNTSSLNLANKVCATCHGGNGQGNPVVGGPRLAGIEPWYLRSQLMGFRAGFRGAEQDYIPGYEMQDSVARLSDAEIDNLVSYVSNWMAPENPASLTGNTLRGSELYVSCAACHGSNGEGNEALAAPGLAQKDDWYLFRQLKLFQSGYRGSHPEDARGRQMRAATGILATDADINDVLAYINTLGT